MRILFFFKVLERDPLIVNTLIQFEVMKKLFINFIYFLA